MEGSWYFSAWPWNFQGMQHEFSGVDGALLCFEFPRGKVKKTLNAIGSLQRHMSSTPVCFYSGIAHLKVKTKTHHGNST